MILLAVDTTTPAGSVALLRDKSLLGEVNAAVSLNFSAFLLPAVDFLLQTCETEAEHIDGFALAAGPGSFTGIRIGISTVSSFSFASGKPAAPVSTLKALALKISRGRERLVCSMLDAKKGEVYAGLYQGKSGRLRETVAPGAYDPEDLLSRLPKRRVVHFIGSGSEVYSEKIKASLGEKARFSQRSPFIAREVGLLGYDLLRRGRGISFEKVQPLYYRKSQAEE